MLNVYQHWDALKTCVVGSCWPPEFFNYINDSKLRKIIETIAIETQEDLDNLSNWLEKRQINVLRPNVEYWEDAREKLISTNQYKYFVPPVSIRDHHSMIGDKFYYTSTSVEPVYSSEEQEWPGWNSFYKDIADASWPACDFEKDFKLLPDHIQQECINHGYLKFRNEEWYTIDKTVLRHDKSFDHIYHWIQSQGNQIIDLSTTRFKTIGYEPGSMIVRVGEDLFFCNNSYTTIDPLIDDLGEFICKDQFRYNGILTGGHGDGTFCPVTPGLIVTYKDQTEFNHQQFSKFFPDWEIVYGSDLSTYEQLPQYFELRRKGFSRWYLENQENNGSLRHFIENYLSNWVGNITETRFFVNILMIDPKNAVVAHWDENIARAMEKYGITCHVLPMRHLFFWDAGTHCVTLDLDRDSFKQRFIHRKNNA